MISLLGDCCCEVDPSCLLWDDWEDYSSSNCFTARYDSKYYVTFDVVDSGYSSNFGLTDARLSAASYCKSVSSTDVNEYIRSTLAALNYSFPFSYFFSDFDVILEANSPYCRQIQHNYCINLGSTKYGYEFAYGLVHTRA